MEVEVDVKVLVHLERIEAPEPKIGWWGESDDLPGFSAAAPSLAVLRSRIDVAVRDILAEQDIYDVDIRLVLVPLEEEEPIAAPARKGPVDPLPIGVSATRVSVLA